LLYILLLFVLFVIEVSIGNESIENFESQEEKEKTLEDISKELEQLKTMVNTSTPKCPVKKECYKDYGNEQNSIEKIVKSDKFQANKEKVNQILKGSAGEYFEDNDENLNIPVYTDYGWSFLPPSKWYTALNKDTTYKFEENTIVKPVMATGDNAGYLTNLKILPHEVNPDECE
jgi:hypothetical protein